MSIKEFKIERKSNHVLFTDNIGNTYHLELDKFDELGEVEASKFVKSELEKKSKKYTKETISFEDARDMGFCEYGIKDFCTKLKLDIDKTYTILELSSKLNKETFLEYSDECLKLFGNDVFKIFGGPKKFLTENRTSKAIQVVLNSSLLTDKQKHVLGCKFAESVLHFFEKERSDDNRPRHAIETKYKWIEAKFGKIE